MGALFVFLVIIISIVVFSSIMQSTAKNDDGEKIIDIGRKNLMGKTKLLIAFFIFIFVLVTLIKGIVVVPAGQRYVVFNVFKGVLENELDEGIHIILPYINSTVSYDVRLQEYTMSSVKGEGRVYSPDGLWSPTKEGLLVGIDMTLLYRLEPDKVSDLHSTIGPAYEAKIIRPAVRSIVRHSISGYSIMEVYSKSRKAIEENIYSEIKEQLKDSYVIVDGVKLRDVKFTERFSESVEKKQVAQQEMERWEYIKDQREKEADARIIEAKGKAEAMKIIARQLKANPDIIKYNYVEKLSDNIKVIVTDQSTIMDLKGLLKDNN